MFLCFKSIDIKLRLSLDIENQIVRFLGRLTNQEVLHYYGTHPIDIFINLSESEGVPVSIMEALAHGIPCVATDVGGTAEVVNEAEADGVLLDVDATIAQIVSSIECVMHAPRMRMSARRVAEEMCSAERNYTEFCSVLTN